MMFYPPKKKSHLPVLFAQHGDVFCRDMNVSQYMGYNVKQHMNFDTTLTFPEICPPEQTQTNQIKVYRRGVIHIQLPIQPERPVN